MEDSHKRDHDRIINMLDCSKSVTGLEMEVALLKEQIREMKSDKEKSTKTLQWVGAMAFSIIMAVAAFGIDSKAVIQVHDEKIKEIKKEVEKVAQYTHDH